MQLTLSSLFITIVFTAILILIFNTLLTNKKSYMLFRTDFLSVLAIIIILRLLFPIEFKFTQSIAAAPIMNPFYNIMHYNQHFAHNLLILKYFSNRFQHLNNIHSYLKITNPTCKATIIQVQT